MMKEYYEAQRIDNDEMVKGWLVHVDLIREYDSGCGLKTMNMSADGKFECNVIRIRPDTIRKIVK